MATPVLRVDPQAVDPHTDVIVRAAAVLRRGGLVAFPTETVYGLGANALDAAAVGRIFTAKGRPGNNPLIVHLADAADVTQVAHAWPKSAQRLAVRFWPGPLTLVLPRGPAVPDAVTAGRPTVAVRVPAHPVARALLRAAGVPLAAPSANRSTRLSPTRAEHVVRDLDERIDLILNGGPTSGGIESTVLDLTTQPPRLLRPGPIEPAALEAVLGPVARGGSATQTGALPSPGMLPRHYAPRTPLVCVEGDGRAEVAALAATNTRVGWLTYFPAPVEDVPSGVVWMELPPDPVGYAAGLYATLHALDEQGLDRIVVALPPEGDAWLAVRDRLRRASA
jgi:L-threonylcarbamoyladenylate synthase